MSKRQTLNLTFFSIAPCCTVRILSGSIRSRLSLRFSRASRVSRLLQSATCRRLFCDLAQAIAAVGLNPTPLIPYPSSFGSDSSWPVISESCHVSGFSTAFLTGGGDLRCSCAFDFAGEFRFLRERGDILFCVANGVSVVLAPSSSWCWFPAANSGRPPMALFASPGMFS